MKKKRKTHEIWVKPREGNFIKVDVCLCEFITDSIPVHKEKLSQSEFMDK